jgi:hypothetical protein
MAIRSKQAPCRAPRSRRSTPEAPVPHTSGVRILRLALVLIAVAGALGCERVREAVDGLRRSNEGNWEQGRRRLGG